MQASLTGTRDPRQADPIVLVSHDHGTGVTWHTHESGTVHDDDDAGSDACWPDTVLAGTWAPVS